MHEGAEQSGIGPSDVSWRPALRGHRHMIVAGHYLAAEAGHGVLEAGGNAVDAGVAAGLALGVVQSDYVNVAGVAPMVVYMAGAGEVATISGLGPWPRRTSLELFLDTQGGSIPEGLLRTVIPGSPDAWITALERYGTMRFADVARQAIRLARDGFVMYPSMAENIARHESRYRRWPSNADIYLPGGSPPGVGDRFVQADLASSLQYMVDEEKAASGDRLRGLAEARNAFYRGDIARIIVRYHEENGGHLSMADLASFRSKVEPALRKNFRGLDIYTCGPWCQGPALLQILGLLGDCDVKSLGHNAAAYIHLLVEATKLSFSDRERFYGDPEFVEVPIDTLLSESYAGKRREMINRAAAWPEMPPPGDLPGHGRSGFVAPSRSTGQTGIQPDTSYVCVVDNEGNAFSATPSDISCDTPVIPGTGLCPSSRGSQSWAVPGHASSVAPGKRPRLTPAPGLAMNEESLMPFGTPGGDMQCQAMLQTLLNVHVFGMDPQQAVEAPRFGSYSFPSSFEPHTYLPGRLNLESAIPCETGEALAELGHDVEWWPLRTRSAGAVCMILADRQRGTLTGGADPRRPSYALGW